MKYFQYFLLVFICDIVSAQVLPNINPVKTITSSDDIIENEKIQNYNLLKKDTTLGSMFQSMNEIRIGLALHRIGRPDSVVFKYLWSSLSINKEQSCNCLNTLEKFKNLDSSYLKLRNKDWFKILRFCNYRVENSQVLNKFNESLEHDLEIILDNDQKYRGEMGIFGFIFGDDALITKKIHELQNVLDSLNLNKIENVISRIGSYPTRKMLANQDLFTVPALVIIHCGSMPIQEKYLPFLLDAYKKESLPLEDIKILIDKIYVHKYNKQVFGTQFGYWDNQLKKKVKYPFLNKEEIKKIVSELSIEE